MKRQQRLKPTFCSAGRGTLSVATRPIFTDVALGKRWPFFPFFLLLILLVVVASSTGNQANANYAFSPVEKLVSKIREINSRLKSSGQETTASVPSSGIDSWKAWGAMQSEVCSFESSIRAHLLHQPAETAPCLSTDSKRKRPPG